MMGMKLTYLLLLIVISHLCYSQQDTIVAWDSVSVKEEYEVPAEDYDQEDVSAGDKYFLDRTGVPNFIEIRTIPDSLVARYQSDGDFWYANSEIRKPKPASSKQSFVEQAWFQTLLWVMIVAGFAGFLIWYLAGANVGLFRRKKRAVDETQVDEELSTEDLFAINYQKEIDKAIAQGDLRLAIRLLFLRLLKNLSERDIIEYKQGKTNFDYLSQLQPTRYYPDFFRITRNYEYSWYGHFEVTPEKFALIKKDFDQLENRLTF